MKFSVKLFPTFIAISCFYFACAGSVSAQKTPAARASRSSQTANAARRDREIASHFAPVFHQGLGNKKRQDYITNFDFDGDWRGDNNWDNADDARFGRRAYVYYAVSETPTHFLIHYAVFHPRDYKGGEGRGPLLSGIIREGVRRGGRYDPTGLSSDAVLAHENDMEGCLVVAAKSGTDLMEARVVFIETLAHDRFSKYMTKTEASGGVKRAFDPFELESGHPLLYIEPKGHGIYAYHGGEKQTPAEGSLVYKFTGRADDPDKSTQNVIGYDLLPLSTTLWPRAKSGVNQTFGAAYQYGTRTFNVAQTSNKLTKRTVKLGTIGAAFRGNTGAPNKARPPWGWSERGEAEASHGEWFFNPAATIKRHFKLDDEFSTSYMHAPFLGVYRK